VKEAFAWFAGVWGGRIREHLIFRLCYTYYRATL
jgi:hypothetical protein